MKQKKTKKPIKLMSKQKSAMLFVVCFIVLIAAIAGLFYLNK